MNGDDGKELADGPTIRRRSKQREVAQILLRENLLEVLELFTGCFAELRFGQGPRAYFPEQHFTFGPIFQTDQAKIELRVQTIFVLQRIVIVLGKVLAVDAVAQFL